MAAFHNGHDRFLDVRIVDTARLDITMPGGKGACAHLFSITQNREVRIVRGKDELNVSLKNADKFDHILEDRLVVQIILWLINDYNVIVTLA